MKSIFIISNSLQLFYAEDDEARLKILNSRGRRGAITDDGMVPEDQEGSQYHQQQANPNIHSSMETMNPFSVGNQQNMTPKILADPQGMQFKKK